MKNMNFQHFSACSIYLQFVSDLQCKLQYGGQGYESRIKFCLIGSQELLKKKHQSALSTSYWNIYVTLQLQEEPSPQVNQ